MNVLMIKSKVGFEFLKRLKYVNPNENLFYLN